MTFTETKTYQNRRAIDAMHAYEFDAETRKIQREHAQPWPTIHEVREVQIHSVPGTNDIVISVITTGGYVISRCRDAQAAIVEAAGYAMRAGWNFMAIGELPDTFTNGFLALIETMPDDVEVTA
jgi:hypothetical protein